MKQGARPPTTATAPPSKIFHFIQFKDMNKPNTTERYFTFPIALLQGAFTDMGAVCNKAVNYAVYVRCEDYQETPAEAFNFFGISGDPENSHKDGEILHDSLDRPPLVSVHKDIVFDFYKNPKTDFERLVFCAFCAVRSIIGKGQFAKSNNQLLIARMFGFRNFKELEATKHQPLHYQSCFSTPQKVRYHLNEKIIARELCLHWGLKYYSNRTRGFYVSFIMSFEELVIEGERRRKSTLIGQKKQQEKAIVERVKHQMKNLK